MTRHKQMTIEIDVDPKDSTKCGEDRGFISHGMFGNMAHCYLFDGMCNHSRLPACIKEFGKEDGE